MRKKFFEKNQEGVDKQIFLIFSRKVKGELEVASSSI